MYEESFIFATTQNIPMMNPHTAYLCLGSNSEAYVRLENARTLLEAAFPGIRFAEMTETEAVGEGWLSPFVNQVAHLHTTLAEDEVRAICKKIEWKCGRTEGEKALGRMSMDVDLLTFDDTVLKPKDMQREYIAQGMRFLLTPDS